MFRDQHVGRRNATAAPLGKEKKQKRNACKCSVGLRERMEVLRVKECEVFITTSFI